MFTILTFLGGVAAGAVFSPFWMKVWNWFKGEEAVVKSDLSAAEAKVKSILPSSTPAPTATAAPAVTTTAAK